MKKMYRKEFDFGCDMRRFYFFMDDKYREKVVFVKSDYDRESRKYVCEYYFVK